MYKVLAFVGALAMIPLFLLQAIVLKAFCSYCVATEVIMLSIWIVSFLLTTPETAGRSRRGGGPDGVVSRRPAHAAGADAMEVLGDPPDALLEALRQATGTP